MGVRDKVKDGWSGAGGSDLLGGGVHKLGVPLGLVKISGGWDEKPVADASGTGLHSGGSMG